jgi:hypothetical protein
VWNDVAAFESRELNGLRLGEHQRAIQSLIEENFRPVAISVVNLPGSTGSTTASVWHRPRIQEAPKQALATRQANAAVALLKLGHEEMVWPLLQHSPDPSVRSWIIHRVQPAGISVDELWNRFEVEPDVSAKRALLLAIGESGVGFQPANSASPIPSQAGSLRHLLTDLTRIYRDDPDPGMHGAAEWVLRRMGETATIAEIDRSLATGKIEGDRQWYLTKQGQTLVVFPPVDEFLMGSPPTEIERFSSERRHRRQIDRRFAIGTKEVTVAEFARFKKANTKAIKHSYTERYAPEESCPQTAVTWYEAAAYCRWLSEEEGLSEEEMCYPPVAEIKEGMKLPPDFLSRSGYRLPTQSEWEWGARAGTTTSRHFGASSLLEHYGWFSSNAKVRTWPVGTLKPNESGLFDALGNVWEWINEQSLSYPSGNARATKDSSQTTQITNDVRVVRGGSFKSNATNLRSAYRSDNHPTNQNSNFGLRISRTYR